MVLKASLGILLSTLAYAAPVYEQMYGGPGPSSATDTQFTLAGGTAYESFGFEVSFNGTQDARINALNSSGTFVFSAARVDVPTWVKGRTYTFSESYSGDLLKLLNISVTDTVTGVTYAIPQFAASFGNIRALIVRMVAPDPDIAGATPRPTAGSLSFNNWQISGQSIGNMPQPLTISTSNNPAVDDIRLVNYFSIEGIDFTQAWTLTGAFTMDWSGSTNPSAGANPLPGANDLAFQVKAYQLDLTPTPEPSTFALFGGALVGLALYAKRRR
jgi:hypothetical protein